MSADFSQMMLDAEARSEERDWAAAADGFAAAAHLAGMNGRVPEAWRAWTQAGECWRRADEPRRAERSLRRALELTEPGGSASEATAPKLAAVLGALGAAERAEDLLEATAAEQAPRSVSPVFTDTRIGLLTALGRKEAARVLLGSLSAADRSGADLAARFRTAQLLVLDGELCRSRNAYRRLVVALHRESGAEAGLGTSLAGLAEVELLLGDERDALGHFESAERAFADAGREALRWVAQHGRVRAMVALGVQPLPGLLDHGISFAEDRGLVPLAAGLRLARGIARADVDPDAAVADLVGAMDDAMGAGLPVLVGRAAFARAVRLPCADQERQTLLETAAMALVSHVPLAARVALARARHVARFDPVQARIVARACLPRLEGMGMSRDALAARNLLRLLEG